MTEYGEVAVDENDRLGRRDDAGVLGLVSLEQRDASYASSNDDARVSPWTSQGHRDAS